MAVTNYSSARRAGFKVNNAGVRKASAITMTKIGTRTLYLSIPPGSFHLSGASVAAAVDGIFVGVTLPDANAGIMYASHRLPLEWSSGTDVTIDIYWKSTAVANDAKFEVQLGTKQAGETAATSDTQTVTTTVNSTANKLNKSTVTFDSSLFAASDWLGIMITRDPTDGDDDLATDLVVAGVVLGFTGQG